MPPLETMDRYQLAVLWPFVQAGNYGTPIVGNPQQIMVRWIDKTSEGTNEQGENIGTSGTLVIDPTLTVSEGSIVREGSLASLPASPDNLMRVSGVDNQKDIRARNSRTVLTLERYKNNLPVPTTA